MNQRSATLAPHPSAERTPIVAREALQFGLDGEIPRYWLAGDAFQTRFFDALSTLFPVGERFFITCVRDFKHRVTDPQLQADIRDFTRQEGQHGLVHGRYNQRLQNQGVEVGRILQAQERRLFGILRRHMSREFTLGVTAAAEHITAIMADCFVEHSGAFERADPRIRAVYVWHAMEEMEHKAVAFDVFQTVAPGRYALRLGAMLLVALLFPFHTARIMNHMFKVDGFTRWQRIRLWLRGLPWLLGRRGILTAAAGKLAAYLKPSFHPWQTPAIPSYVRWVAAMQETGDPVTAADSLWLAPRPI